METLLLLGFALGLKHSIDADHIAAVSALVRPPAQGGSHLANARTGALWGAGHLLAVLLAGGALLVWRVNLPGIVAAALELLVASVLIGLGVRTIREVLGSSVHFHFHQHGGNRHAHPHLHDAGEPHDQRAHDAHLPAHSHAQPQRGAGAFLLGTLHGLAGTAGLTLLVLTTIPSRPMALLYLALFGAGALAGMTLFSATLSALLHGGARWLTCARLAAGAANTIVGAVLAHRILSSI